MSTVRPRQRRRVVPWSVAVLRAAALGAGVLAMAACGTNAVPASGDTAPAASAPGGGANGSIGVILPETATSARWEAFDKPMLAAALGAQGFAATVENAQGDVQKFSSLADGMIASRVRVLIIAAPNAEVGAAVAARAKQAGIPTIDYDRLSVGGVSDYYVSFDNVQVGVLQAQALVTALRDRPGAQVIQIEGAPDENNAILFHRGQMTVLRPLYDAGTLRLVRDQFTPNWDNQLGGTEFEQILTGNGGRVDGVLAANDGMAGAVITVLRKNHLNGRVPVTGQDATLAGLRSVLSGDQTMTVFKAIRLEADAAARLAAALARGDRAGADAYAAQETVDPTTGRKIRSVLLAPESVGRADVKRVVDQGYVTPAQLCAGDLATGCASLDIAP